MMNIFSSFNPLNFFFMSTLIINLMLTLIIWEIVAESKIKKIYVFFMMTISKDFIKINKSVFCMNVLVSTFFYNSLLNLSNLLPFSFCMNSQLQSVSIFCVTMWMSCVIYSLVYFYKNFFSHLTPMGCPMMLSPLMVIIEFMSLIIRPITLSVRLSANMLAGHLLIHLLTDFSLYLMNFSIFSMAPMIMLLMILNLLEISVSVIQPYILCVLINMYLSESN